MVVEEEDRRPFNPGFPSGGLIPAHLTTSLNAEPQLPLDYSVTCPPMRPTDLHHWKMNFTTGVECGLHGLQEATQGLPSPLLHL